MEFCSQTPAWLSQGRSLPWRSPLDSVPSRACSELEAEGGLYPFLQGLNSNPCSTLLEEHRLQTRGCQERTPQPHSVGICTGRLFLLNNNHQKKGHFSSPPAPPSFQKVLVSSHCGTKTNALNHNIFHEPEFLAVWPALVDQYQAFLSSSALAFPFQPPPPPPHSPKGIREPEVLNGGVGNTPAWF